MGNHHPPQPPTLSGGGKAHEGHWAQNVRPYLFLSFGSHNSRRTGSGGMTFIVARGLATAPLPPKVPSKLTPEEGRPPCHQIPLDFNAWRRDRPSSIPSPLEIDTRREDSPQPSLTSISRKEDLSSTLVPLDFGTRTHLYPLLPRSQRQEEGWPLLHSRLPRFQHLEEGRPLLHPLSPRFEPQEEEGTLFPLILAPGGGPTLPPPLFALISMTGGGRTPPPPRFPSISAREGGRTSESP